jgi:signal transduction histidine kinase
MTNPLSEQSAAPDTASKTRPRLYSRSSSFQMAILFTLLCGGALLILGYFGYYFARGYFVYGTENVIDSEIRYVTAHGAPEKLNYPGRMYSVFGNGVDRPPEVPQSVSLLSEGMIVFDHTGNGKKYAAKIHTFDDGRKVLVGVDISQISKDYRFMLWLSLVSILCMLAVIGVSFMISVFVVKRTNRIADTAREIMITGDLTRRIDINTKSRWDDLSNMAGALNLLLGRIETLMQGVKQVSDNIAHDLRTPLTRMKNHIETLRKQDPDNKDYEDLASETEALLSTFNALLRISRIESEQKKSQFAEIDLGTVLHDVIAFYEPLAEEKDIKINYDLKSVKKFGDRDLLFQSFANLLDNAIKFTPSGGEIKIILDDGGGT